MCCSVEGCERPAVARGLCKVCHQRQRRAAQRAERPRELAPLAATQPTQTQLDQNFNFRLSLAELHKLHYLAERAQMPASTLLRAWIRGAK